ncbi:unnamed protein product [Xylocopa violacea]|uniref:Uncharacterized protein n=1 Tax=Xylocopa violacea TaxID=135666 RepID=A0ABP1P024_XYLVO
MNSEESASNSQNKSETRLEGSLKKNGNQSIEQSAKPSKVIQLESKLNGDQVKLNNKLGDNSAKNYLSPNGPAFANGTRSTQATCDFINSMDQSTDEDMTNSSASSTFLNANNIKSPTMNTAVTSQLKHKTVINTSVLNLPKPQMHLNLSSNNTHLNHTCVSGSYNAGATSSPILHLNNSTSVLSTIQSNLSTTKPNDDIDMKNNVDYISGIEKCPSKVSCSSDSSPEVDSAWTSRSYGSNSVLNNIGGSIGSTSQGTCCFLRPNINGNREVAGPSGLQRSTQREQIERRDSSSGNEGDMSDGEDYCIYTYKGNDDALHLAQKEEVNQEEIEEHEEEEQCHSGRSSPEMDFLEMDFDPGPSCEQDTGDSDLASINEDIQNIALDNVDPDPVLNDLSSGKVVAKQGIATTSQNSRQSVQNVNNTEPQPCSSSSQTASKSSIKSSMKPSYPLPWVPSTSGAIGKWETTRIFRRTRCPLRESYGYHNTSGDLISPGDNRDSDAELWVESSSAPVPENSSLNSRRVNLSSTLYHRMMAKKLMLNKQAAFSQSGDSNLENELSNERLDGLLPVEKVMLWSEQEATVKQVTQIGTSACGATAAINALLALNVQFSLETLVKGVNTRQREPGTPLPRYLYSRSVAGSTHRDLARGIALGTNGSVITKFFAFYPERKVSLSHWLHYWISKGAAPIATLNLQHCGEGCDIPDAWHHQMIFGVGQAGIYLSNPLECLPEQYVWHQLVSPSILLVRRADVLAHWNPNTDLTPLATMDQMWRKLNVLGQVVNMVREAMSQRRQLNLTAGVTHIRIPASYRAGITLVMCANSAAASELLHAEQLPIL